MDGELCRTYSRQNFYQLAFAQSPFHNKGGARVRSHSFRRCGPDGGGEFTSGEYMQMTAAQNVAMSYGR